MLTAEMVKEFALECGADAVGIGSMDRFEGAPKEMDPRYIYPNAKSVIGMVFRIPRGYMRGLEEGTQFYQYPSMGYGAINEDFAPTVLYQVGRLIEDHGYEAGVYRNTGGRGSVSDLTGKPGITESPEEHKRAISFTQPASPDLPPPDVFFHFRIAAFICGWGEIGLSKLFLSPKFGPLNRQAFIFTDAPLEADPLYDGPPLCNKCKACIAQCQGHCLSKTDMVSITVAGRTIEWAHLDEWGCFAYYIGANRSSNPFLPQEPYPGYAHQEALLSGEKRIEADEYGTVYRMVNQYYPPPTNGYNPPKCGGCLRACIASLEQRHVLQNSFANPFRTAKPWRVG
jgi:ferredoxin